MSFGGWLSGFKSGASLETSGARRFRDHGLFWIASAVVAAACVDVGQGTDVLDPSSGGSATTAGSSSGESGKSPSDKPNETSGGSSVGGQPLTADGGAGSNGPIDNGGTANQGGDATGGTGSDGNSGMGGGGGGSATRGDGPCDIYASGNTPCVAAYSLVRALKKGYAGPLFKVRSGSSDANTGEGGLTRDIDQLADGYADTATLNAFCNATVCTVATLYDQSGNGNDLTVAKKGSSNGGMYAAFDDFESSATKGVVTAGGRSVPSLYMDIRQGYRTALGVKGKGMPLGTAPQGIYMLADGMHSATACCWEFGNVSTDPLKFAFADSLFLGVGYWGKGNGSGPWFMADFEGGLWAGGSAAGQPGWGRLGDEHDPNTKNLSMKVPFAMGILKTQPSKYALRSADLTTASDLNTSYEGAMFKTVDHQGGIVLGVASDNSNSGFGTFYEGAIVSGYPSDATDLAVFKNVKAVGYQK